MTDDDDRLRRESAEIEHLLAEIESLVPAPAWQRVERVLARVVRLYGAGLARALDHAREAGARSPLFDERVADDELLASLLVLHGLHPLSVEERVRRGLDMIRAELGIADTALQLIQIEEHHAILRAVELGGAMSTRVAEGAIRKVLAHAAPEITTIEFAGAPPPRDPSLVQLRLRREVP